jgi:hypothetical protein
MRFFYLYAGIYASHCAFSSLKNFIDSAPSSLDGKVSIEKFCAQLEQAAHSLKINQKLVTESSARSHLIAEDLDRVRRGLDASDLEILEDLAQHPLRDFDAYVSILRRLGANFDPPRLYLVDELPTPFNQFQWAAFCPDIEDEKRYGIPRGIYFRRTAIRPYSTQALLAHEMIHCIPGGKDTNLLAMGLEEGIADLLGSLYLTSRRYDNRMARNLYIYSRHAQPISKVWKLYLEHARQAAILYKRFGLTGIISLLNEGRRTIHEVETRLRIGHFSNITLPSGNWDPALDELVDEVLLAYPSSYVVSPLAYYLLRFLQEGLTLSDICSQANVPFAVGKEILEQLSANTTLFLIDNGRIGYSNVGWYLEPDSDRFPILRYET